MKTTSRLILSLLLCVLLCLCALPAAWADDSGVTIPAGTVAIGDGAFAGCADITAVTIPTTVLYIGDDAFLGCGGLGEIRYGGSPAQWAQIHIGAGNEALNGAVLRFADGQRRVPVSRRCFPDDAFRAYVAANFDTDGDGLLSADELAAVTTISIIDSAEARGSIASLRGVEYFPALTGLTCHYNELSAVDLSGNPALKWLNLVNNQLEALDVSANPQLVQLNFNANRVSSLDLRENGLLRSLGCEGNRLSELDLSRNTALTDLNVSNNRLTSLDVGMLPGLTRLWAQRNGLTELDISACPQLLDAYRSGERSTQYGYLSYKHGDNELPGAPDTNWLRYDWGVRLLTASDLRNGRISLYGENHSSAPHRAQELAIWKSCYDRGMRDLFVEYASYTADFLNLWMRADSDDILLQLYDDWEGTMSHSELVLDFYRSIKAGCPETIFHGTDVGHQYNTTGARYLAYLKAIGQEDSEAYARAAEVCEQGRRYYAAGNDYAYRENCMVQNFMDAYERLNGLDAVGFYGADHTRTDGLDASGAVPCMGAQLIARYGAALYTEQLAGAPLSSELMTVDGKSYTASYFGWQDISSWSAYYTRRDFWRLENAYADFRSSPLAGDNLPENNYPMAIQAGQVFVIDYTLKTGGTFRELLRCDGNYWDGRLVTHAFRADAPIRSETMVIGGKSYTATYYGQQDISERDETYACRDFWRLENAYADFWNSPLAGDNLPENNYLMTIQAGQVFVVDYRLKTGGTFRELLRCDGNYWDGRLLTHAFSVS